MMFQSKSKFQVYTACEVSQLNNYLWKLKKEMYASSPQILEKKKYVHNKLWIPYMCAF